MNRIVNSLRKRLNTCFKKKSMHTFDYLDMDYSIFKEWLELAFNMQHFNKDLTINNYGSVWALDHVIPCAIFNMEDEEEAKICFHWSNIQPLISSLNSAKRDKIIQSYITHRDERMKVFCEKHNIDINQIELITVRAKKLALERRSNVLSIVKTSIQTGQSAAKPLKIIRKPEFKYPDQQIIHEEGSETKQVSGIHIGSSG